jgi:glycine betaine/proline transport system permease protein
VTDTTPRDTLSAGQRWTLGHQAGVLAAFLLLLVAYKLTFANDSFPETLHYALREPVDEFADWVAATFRFILRPISLTIKSWLKQLDGFFLGLSWPIIVFGALLLVGKMGGLRLGLFAAACLMLIGSLGLWDSTIKTLTIMTLSVTFTVIVGIPIGVWAARSDRFEAVLRPILDAMQTMPAFVYLIPVMLLFGIGATSAVFATMVYAVPPVIRLTNLGIRQVAAEAIEAAASYGSTYRQTLFKVQLPMAKPSIMMGVNQTVMMALAMVIFVALIGASGLGKDIWVAMRRLQIGRAVEAGLAVVLMAVVLDRIGYALSRGGRDGDEHGVAGALAGAGRAARAAFESLAAALARCLAAVARPLAGRRDPGPVLRALLTRNAGFVVGALVLAALVTVDLFGVGLGDYPAALEFRFGKPIDVAARWMNINLAFITDPMRTYFYVYLLLPTRDFLLWLPWPVFFLALIYIAWLAAGWRIAALTFVGLTFIGVAGEWESTMVTLSQVTIALGLSVVIAVPLGVLAARNDRFEMLLRPALDTMQTLPAFVYFPLVIMLFKVGDLSGIIATVIYAVPPAVRLTNLGIRQVPAEVVEAARSYGSTPLQILFKIELPLALPSIMMGINQTTMMALAMVIYAALIGARGLGFDVVRAIGKFDVGAGFEAGMSIVFLAVIADRVTQGWALKRQRALGLSGRLDV